MIIAVTRCHCVCNSLNLSCGCYCGGSFCFNLDGPIATGGDDVGACIYPRMIGLNSDGLKKRFGNVFFLPCLLLSYYWSMRICFATGEKQPIANPTVKLLFLHSGCCFEVVGTALSMPLWCCFATRMAWVKVPGDRGRESPPKKTHSVTCLSHKLDHLD